MTFQKTAFTPGSEQCQGKKLNTVFHAWDNFEIFDYFAFIKCFILLRMHKKPKITVKCVYFTALYLLDISGYFKHYTKHNILMIWEVSW